MLKESFSILVRLNISREVPCSFLPVTLPNTYCYLVTSSIVLIIIIFFSTSLSIVNTFAQDGVDTKDRIAAIVNDDVITLSELDQEIATFMPQLNTQFAGEELLKQVKQARYKLLVSMIERKLQLQQAQAMRLSVSDREVDSTAQDIRARRGEDPATTPTASDRKEAKEQLLLMRVYQQKIRNTLLIPENSLREYYNSNQEEFRIPGEVSISQIMLSVSDSGSLEKAHLRSEHVLNEIKNGRPFEELAKDYSDGPEAKHGGSLGVMIRGSLLPQMEQSIDLLDPGEIGQIIESPVGFHIIRVDEKKPAGFKGFEEVKEEIESKLLREQSQQVYQEWLNELKDTAFIEVRFE
tara:strand:- start:8262 stop:9314 length:1053 start_codon:yes stop_codon:yes gene_type:complete